MSSNIVETVPHVPSLPDVSTGKLLLDAMKRNADRVAYIEAITGEQESYGDVRLRSIRLAQALMKFGIKPGDVVTLMTRNTKHSLVALTGALAVGAIVNPLDVALGVDDISHILKTTQPRIVFTERIAAQKMIEGLKNFNSKAEVVILGEDEGPQGFQNYQKSTGTENQFEPVDVGDTAEATAFLLCSSGSTGPPKAVISTHACVRRPFVQCMVLDSSSRVFTFTSIYWSSGLFITLNSCLFGSTRIVTTEPFSEELLFKYIKQYEITNIALSHILFGKMSRHPLVKTADLSKIRDIWIGGGGVPAELIQYVNDRLPNGFVRMCYGQTEVSSVAIAEDKHLKPGSVGKMIPGCTGKIVDLDNNTVLGRNQKGELCIKPSFKVKGYYNNPEATAELFDEDGWVKTGDVGYFDDDGFLFLVDRKKSMMRTSGMFSCSPNDLEHVLYEHPAVKSAAVVGARGKDLFDVPVAFIILKPGCKATEQELQKLVADKLPVYKHLTGGVIFTEEISMTPSGKYRIGELKKQAQAMYDKRFVK